MNTVVAKYKIEGDINFFSELTKSLNSSSSASISSLIPVNSVVSDESSPKDDACCLITGAPLAQYFVTLKCNHTFNYLPLYNELTTQKCTKNTLEVIKLGVNQLKCPYCRSIQNGIMPFHPELSDCAPLLYGVNTIDISHHKCLKCNYVKYTDGAGLPVFCSYESQSFSTLESDKKTYCSNHYYQMKLLAQKQEKKQQILDAKNKIKEEAMKTKEEAMKTKEEAKKVKQLAVAAAKQVKIEQKLAEKEAKKLAIVAAKQESVSNEIIGTSINSTEVITCVQILKTGANKGAQCCKSVYLENMCKRHYNLTTTPTQIDV
jgi:hypothetical protein